MADVWIRPSFQWFVRRSMGLSGADKTHVPLGRSASDRESLELGVRPAPGSAPRRGA